MLESSVIYLLLLCWGRGISYEQHTYHAQSQHTHAAVSYCCEFLHAHLVSENAAWSDQGPQDNLAQNLKQAAKSS